MIHFVASIIQSFPIFIASWEPTWSYGETRGFSVNDYNIYFPLTENYLQDANHLSYIQLLQPSKSLGNLAVGFHLSDLKLKKVKQKLVELHWWLQSATLRAQCPVPKIVMLWFHDVERFFSLLSRGSLHSSLILSELKSY